MMQLDTLPAISVKAPEKLPNKPGKNVCMYLRTYVRTSVRTSIRMYVRMYVHSETQCSHKPNRRSRRYDFQGHPRSGSRSRET